MDLLRLRKLGGFKPVQIGRIRLGLLVSMILVLPALSAVTSALAQTDEDIQKAVDYFQQGQNAHEKGELPLAVELYKKALHILPEFPEAEFQLGNAYLSLNQPDNAERAFRRAAAMREDWTPPIAALGSLLVSDRRFDEARPLLLKTLSYEPRNPVALSALTELYLNTSVDPSNLRDLLQQLTEATNSARPTAILLAARSSVQLRLGDARGALASAERAVSADPQSLSAAVAAANAALANSDPEKAEAFIRPFLASGRSSDQIDIIKARIAAARGQISAAIALLEPLAEKSDEAARLLLALKAATSENPAEIEASLASDPKNVQILGRLCDAYRTRDPLKAMEYCRRASEEMPGEIRFAAGYAAALVQARRYDEAISLLQKLLTVQPENSTMRANLATALFQANRLQEARTEFIRLTEAPNPAPAAYYFRAIVQDRLGEYLDAMANYQLFLNRADPTQFGLEIEKVKLRLPALEKAIKNTKRK